MLNWADILVYHRVAENCRSPKNSGHEPPITTCSPASAQHFLYIILISQNQDNSEIPFINLAMNPKNSLSRCEVTFMSQHKRLKAKLFTNEGIMCLFQRSSLKEALHECTLSVIAYYTQPGLEYYSQPGVRILHSFKTNRRSRILLVQSYIDRGFVFSYPSFC